MKLTELLLNRFLYRESKQDLETKDSVYNSSNVVPDSVTPISSGGAAQDINTGNVFINGAQLEPGTYPVTVLDVSNWGWGQTCAFSSSSATQVNWGAGTFTSASGVSYSISAGNTGTMAAKTYIYLDLLVSETAYQKTTTPADAVGVGKVLVAVAQNAATGNATYNLSEATQIVGDNILANSINASKIVTGQLIVGTNVGLGTAQDSAGVTTIIGGTVTTSYVNALNITALGTVTAGALVGLTITGGTIRTAVSGQRVEITGAGNAIAFYSSSALQGQMYGTNTSGGTMVIDAVTNVALSIGSSLRLLASSSGVAVGVLFSPSTNNTVDMGGVSTKFRDLYCRDVWGRDLHATRDIDGVDIYGSVHPDNGVTATFNIAGTDYYFLDGILVLVI